MKFIGEEPRSDLLARSIGRISKIGESYFNDTIRIPEFWVTCRSFKGERAREWLHRIALLEARDYRPPFRNEKEREKKRRARELGRSDCRVCCRTGYLTNVRSKTCPG